MYDLELDAEELAALLTALDEILGQVGIDEEYRINLASVEAKAQEVKG